MQVSAPGLAAYPAAMMIDFLGWVARRRAAVLTTALLTAVVLQVLRQATGNGHSFGLNLAFTLLPVSVLVLGSALSVRVFHSAKLVARPDVPAFEVSANPSAVLGAAGYTFFVASVVGSAVRDNQTSVDFLFAAGSAVLPVGVLVALWWAALGRFGVRLGPDGIIDRQPFGSLHVPWEALAIPRPAFPRNGQQVTLHLARPELVRRRGLRFGAQTLLPAAGLDPELLARAIHEYANRADIRSTIGSEAASAQFQAIPQIVELANRP
jgi:hypothetical protein